MTKPWYHESGVVACPTCDGRGEVASHKRPSTGDPYPTKRCEDCHGPHSPECPVCGFDQVVSGWDCLACDIVRGMTAEELENFSVVSFSVSLRTALQEAQADAERGKAGAMTEDFNLSAVPELLTAAVRAFDFFGSVDGAVDVRAKLLAAILKVRRMTP